MRWMVHRDFPQWSISDTGIVYSNVYSRILKQRLVTGKWGSYVTLAFKVGPKTKNKKLHTLVAELFLDNPRNCKMVNHKDGNKLNNNYKNLEWCTNQENCIHAVESGLNKKRGQYNQNSKLTDCCIPVIKEMFRNGIKQPDLAALFEMNQSCISRIVNNKTYRKKQKLWNSGKRPGRNQSYG